MSSTRLASSPSAASSVGHLAATAGVTTSSASSYRHPDDSGSGDIAAKSSDRPPSLGPIATSTGLLDEWTRSTSSQGLFGAHEIDLSLAADDPQRGPGDPSSSTSLGLYKRTRQRYSPTPLDFDPSHSVSSSKTVQPASASTARFPHRDSSASIATVGSRTGGRDRDRTSAHLASAPTSPPLGIGSGNGVGAAAVGQDGVPEGLRLRVERRGSPPRSSYFPDAELPSSGMDATVPAPSSHLTLPHLVPSTGSGASSSNPSSSASSSRAPSTSTSPAFAAVKLFPPTPIGTPTSAGSNNLALPKNRGFVVTSRPSPGSSASSSGNTSPVARPAGLAVQGGNSAMTGWSRPASIAGVLAASYTSSPTEGAQFSTIRPVGSTSATDSRRRTFADMPRDQSIYPFAAPPGASALSSPALVDAALDLAIPVDDQASRGGSFSEASVGRPSLLTQQILSSPAVPTVSSSSSTALGSVDSRIEGNQRNQPASSPSTPRAAASRRLGGGAGLFHSSSHSNSSSGLAKRSSLLGGWTQHFSGSRPSEHDEETRSGVSRRESKGKERGEMGPPADDGLGSTRRGKLGSRSSARTGSLSQGHSASGSASGTASASGSLNGRPGANRSRDVSGGSGLSGYDGDDGRQDRNDVIETAELNFVRDPTSGRKMINQYLIMQEIGRGQHGTVRLGKDMTHSSPDQSRANTASSSASALVSRRSSATQVQQLQGEAGTSPRQIATSPVSESNSGQGSPEGSRPLSKSVNSSSHSSLAQAVVQTQHLALSETELGSSPPFAGDFGLQRKGSTDERGSYWAIKIVDRAPKRRLPGVSAIRKAQAQGQSRPSAPINSTGEKIKREIAILKKCRHPNVVRLREVIDAEVSKKIYLILEYCEGGEVKWKSAEGRPDLTIGETRRIFRDVVCGLQYLHHQGIIHRDIKPANLLFGKNDMVKISDFGVSHYSHVHRHHDDVECDSPGEDDPAYMDDHELAKTAGSPAFFAPELCYNGDTTPLGSITPGREKNEFNFTSLNAAVARTRAENSTGSTGGKTLRADTPSGDSNRGRSRPPITAAIDVWALGVTLYCLFFGRVPFEAPSEYALFSIIPTQDFEIPPTMGADQLPTGGRHAYKQGKSSGVAEEAREALDILERLLEKDPTKRIKLPDVKRHPFTLRGLSDPTAWLVSTDPAMDTYVTVSNDEVAAAVTDTGSFKAKFRKGVKQFTHKLHAIASGAGYKSRSRSSSFLQTPNDERPAASFSDDRNASQSSSLTGSQLNSPTTRSGPRGAVPPRSPRMPINDYEMGARSASPHPPPLSRRMSLLGKNPAQVDRGQQAGQYVSLTSPASGMLGLPDTSDMLGRSVSDRSTTSSSGFAPFRIHDRHGSQMLGVPKQSLGSAGSNEHLPRPLATSTSAEDLDGMILSRVTGTSVSSRTSGGLNLRRRQSSDIDGAGRQRTLSSASSSKGNFSRLTRYISRGLSQKSSSAGSSAPRGGGMHRHDFSPSPTSDGDMEDESHSGHGSPLRNARLRSVSGDDIGRKSLETTSSYSGAPSSPVPRGSSSMFPSLPLPDFDNASFDLASRSSRDKMYVLPAEAAQQPQETYDLEDGVDSSDDDDFGQHYTRHLEHPEELNRGNWRMNASGIQGRSLEPSAMVSPESILTKGLGLTTDVSRFSDAEEGDHMAETSAPVYNMLSPLQPLTPATEEGNAMDDVTPLAAPHAWKAPKSPTSPTTTSSTSFAEHRRRSMSRGSARGSPLRSSLPDRSRSPFGLDRRWVEESVDDEDEDDEEEEGLAIDIGKRGRRGSKPLTPMTGRTLDLP